MVQLTPFLRQVQVTMGVRLPVVLAAMEGQAVHVLVVMVPVVAVPDGYPMAVRVRLVEVMRVVQVATLPLAEVQAAYLTLLIVVQNRLPAAMGAVVPLLATAAAAAAATMAAAELQVLIPGGMQVAAAVHTILEQTNLVLQGLIQVMAW